MLTASATTHSRSNGDFPVLGGLAPNWRSCLARFCLCTGVLESPRPFRPLCLCPENSLSPQRRLRFEETGSNAMSVKAVFEGRIAICPEIAQVLASGRVQQEKSQLEDLSPREFEILRMILEARTTDEIATAFHVSRKTVANYHYNIKSKLGVSSDIELGRRPSERRVRWRGKR